ncbi:Glucans biosynthesis glucosyltransferase H [Frankliniella fusca]|uniref:Glucans biosynthesis glucosyltransferase H n=1 Tax=Frankliniella fusca TaxID=407009 RepID=A0AAE1LA11_9NEOP|nr:Glucans biosynthesis glucosyltransferase H [Frankliniella fusca]
MISLTAGTAASLAKIKPPPAVHKKSPRKHEDKEEEGREHAPQDHVEPPRCECGSAAVLVDLGGLGLPPEREPPCVDLSQLPQLSLTWLLCAAMWVYVVWKWPEGLGGLLGGILGVGVFVPTAFWIIFLFAKDCFREELEEGDDGWPVPAGYNEGGQEVDTGAGTTAVTLVTHFREPSELLPNAVNYYHTICEVKQTETIV